MGLGFYLSLAMLPVMVILAVIFFLKKKINNEETKIYKYILIMSIIMTIFEIISALLYVNYFNTFCYNFVAKMVLVSYIFVNFLFCKYLMTVCKNSKTKFSFLYLLTLLVLLLVLFTNTKYVEVNGSVAPQGLPVTLTFFYAICLGTYQLILAILNRKTIKAKKFTPCYIFLIFGAINVLIISFYPTSFVVGYLWCLSIIVMNFTIENPDVKMLEKLEIAKAQADKANRAKSDFLSSMSHEIRTPLNAIVGLSEDIASYKDQVPKEVVEDTEDIQNASQTLLEIVGNILDISKIESEKMEIVESPYNFKETIINLSKVTSTRIGDKPIEFKLDIAEDIPYELIGDKVHVKQVVNNILSNAFKYTEEGSVNLNIKCINDTNKNICNLMITCQDTGRGIKPEMINKLFNKFERLDIEKNTTTEGTGLGLAITKSLVEMMGGKINVQSSYGKGSMFMIQIPQKVSKYFEPMTEKELSDTMARQYKSTTIVNPTNEVNNEVPSYGHKKILIVDDNKLNIKVARRALSSFDFEIDECFDGIECLDKLKENTYDLILMDIMMPNLNGEQTLERLKEDPNFKIPTIALTADALSGAKEKYIGLGFVDYIAKPFSREQIKEKLDKVFTIKEEVKKEDRWKDVPTYVFGNKENVSNN